MSLQTTLPAAITVQEPLVPVLLEEASFELPTIREDSLPHAVQEACHLVSGSLFKNYRLIRPLTVLSGEADLWLVQDADSETQFILKYYRYGVFPKDEIMTVLRQMRREHIVDIREVGQHAERIFEIQEYIENGSLSDWMKEGISSDDDVRNILRELTSALTELHSHQILHRDIKPSNVLVRSRDPIDLVLTDFGISSLSDELLHITTTHRTPSYCAPEALTGIITKASDWWSVGVILIEALLKYHPFRGCTEQMVNFQLVTRGLSVPSELSPDWQMILKGLLTRDYAKRWSADQILSWLEGARDIPVYYQDPAGFSLREQKPYKFAGELYRDPPSLAEALALNWIEGVKQIAFGYVPRWIETEVQDQSLGLILREISADRQLRPAQKLSAALMALNPELPLIFEGEIIDCHWCAQHLSKALDLTGTSLPGWLIRLRKDSSLLNWRSEYDSLRTGLAAYQVPLNNDLIEQLFAADPGQVITAALALRQQFAGSSNEQLAKLLEFPTLDFTQALLLLSCDRALFLTPQQLAHHRQLAHIREFDCYLDEEFADKLLHAGGFAPLQGLWNQARRHYRLRRESHVKFENGRLTEILSKELPDTADAIAVLANRLAYRNSFNQILIPIPGLRVLFSLKPVCQVEYLEFVKAHQIHWKPPKTETSGNHPIVNVSWEEASLFCDWLTERERKLRVIGPHDSYRLPSDLEWSAAIGLQNEPGQTPLERASKIKSIYPWGIEWPPPPNFGGGLRHASPVEVGSFPPNHLGIYDMGINVMEWAWDWDDDQSRRAKVARGAAWCHSTPDDFLSSIRRFYIPAHRSDTISFRIVLMIRSFRGASTP